jgi:hypothetical protein
MTAARTTVMLDSDALRIGELAVDRTMQAEHAVVSHATELAPCGCQHEGHWVYWRGYPVLDPGPCPAGGVLDEVAEGCFCCFWGAGPVGVGESLHARLSREAHDGRDIHVEHRNRRGRWTKFEETF